MVRSLMCVAIASLAGAALGQTQTNFENMIGRMSSYCFKATGDASKTPQERLATCQQGIGPIEQMGAANTSITPKEKNVYNLVRGSIYMSIASSQGKIDPANLAAMCASTEKAWAAVAQINLADTPEAERKSYVASRDAAVTATRACRTKVAAPAGAPALPSP